ncbi:Pescadillo_cell cycle regulator [Hexamita inflata]|uniref:Pescadillo cell cycle regulator n=1 Tax=Hexamita inflata TaxID=28002 RepID=A0AA86PBD3_9EUKA|nr:Pescadillo cell cycle regulator [Hexamita inflata]CAI9941756.1 Pescadillo cell cycle regulator [Hexamita inflata]
MVQYGVAVREKKHDAKESSENTFVTRAKAIKFLQVSNAEFRKLCILKGIFPRQPPKQFAGLSAYYFKKDITHLARDPVVDTLRRLHAYKKKHTKFTYLRDEHALKFLELSKPNYDIQRLVKERYPTPDAAIADLDDCLSLVALFSTFSTSHTNVALKCRNLLRQFDAYVAGTSSLRRSFVSTKGFYFQAIVQSQLVTWSEPHKFNVEIPEDVELEVLKTFVDFYMEMLKFVLIYLFKQLQIQYPLQQEENGVDFILEKTLFIRESISQFNFKQTSLQQTVFNNQIYKLNREVPRDQLEFLVLCGGGNVISSSVEDDNRVTHLIADRQMQPIPGREIIQPQYCFDSFNVGVCLPTYEYAVAQQLPSHLSPFQFDFTTEKQTDEVQYVPERLTQLVNYYKQFVLQIKPEAVQMLQEQESIKERELLGQIVKLQGADQELESSEEELKTNFDYDQKIKQDLEIDPKLRQQKGMLSQRKRRVYDELLEKEDSIKKQREQLIQKRREKSKKEAREEK